MEEGTQIPLERTVSSYDVVTAFSDLTRTTERIDTDQLAASLDVLATEFADTPENVRTALDGLSRLSRTIASRDEKLRELLRSANSVTGSSRTPTSSSPSSTGAARRSTPCSPTPTRWRSR